jgi:hypothetical protein
MHHFFKALFEAYPVNDPHWKVYSQRSFKIAIRYKNTTGAPREMKEIRSGLDGTIELKDGRPHLLPPNEIRWIAIEPSDKSFYYNPSKKAYGYGAAAYPKRLDDARRQWDALDSDEMQAIAKHLIATHNVIPFYQIADTLASLYPEVCEDGLTVATLALRLEKAFKYSDTTLGYPGKIRVFQSNARVLGWLVQDTKFNRRYSTFPMNYRDVPIEKGSLLVIDLTQKLRLKRQPVKYAGKITAPIVARIIDAPAVKGAQWTPLPLNDDQLHQKTVSLQNAQRILCDIHSFTKL